MHLAMDTFGLRPKRTAVAVREEAGYCKKPTFNPALCSGVEVSDPLSGIEWALNNHAAVDIAPTARPLAGPVQALEQLSH